MTTFDDGMTKLLAGIEERNRRALYEEARRQQEWVARYLPPVDKPKDQPWAPPHDETDPDSAPELRANTTDEADR